ncbi:amino acid ABC transporter permease [Oceanicella sp. SM1341]|uniref:amino acid ABC transporter permease n=1 Tax=Oceanicella sp. SM1341 TaxID=1548889 RepID=UPI000E52406A|nr:amino acid ABC transporter permease [Oceanicella sp. SM1341]
MDIAAPPKESLAAWAHRRLFSTWFDRIVTLVFGAGVAWVLWQVLGWAFLGAVWSAPNSDACAGASGACWAVIEARGRLILFGLYPAEEHWRSALACLAVMLTMGLSCWPLFWHVKRLAALWVAGFGLFLVLMRGGVAGLAPVTAEQWGGLSLTLFIFCGVVVAGMPMAVGLALARRSKLPVVRGCAGGLIDVVRSLPLLTLLFTAAVVVPLMVPGWLQGDKLVRVVLAYALFFACYQAEILRAGLQSVHDGQGEAAAALGLSPAQRVFLIELPQAFRNTLPSTINQVVITFKETSIVTIIGFFEVMASGNAALGSGDWGRAFIEVYVFLGLVYFVFVFGLSRYGAWLEARMRRGQRH